MPIRPIDMQVSIPKLAEVSRMRHLENSKAGIQQDQGSIAAGKETVKEQHTVMESNKDEKSGNDADPRRKGRNKYSDNKKKKKDDDDHKDDGPESYHKIDIRI